MRQRKTATRAAAAAKAELPPVAAAAATPAPGEPRDAEQLRRSAAFKLETFERDWWRCPRRACRRHGRCIPAHVQCASPRKPRRELTPDQEQRQMAILQRMLRQRLGQGL